MYVCMYMTRVPKPSSNKLAATIGLPNLSSTQYRHQMVLVVSSGANEARNSNAVAVRIM